METFGDVATSIGVHFETYITVVAGVLQQANNVSVANDVSFDMLDYIVSLRSGIADAWSGLILAFKGTEKGMQDQNLYHDCSANTVFSSPSLELRSTRLRVLANRLPGHESQRRSS